MIITTSAETNLVRLNAATVVASMVIKPEPVALILSARWLLKAVICSERHVVPTVSGRRSGVMQEACKTC